MRQFLPQNRRARTAYSLRHNDICFRLLKGADIYQVAKNCRTSVEMIEKHYAAHLKDMIDTSLVNVRGDKNRGRARAKKEDQAGGHRRKRKGGRDACLGAVGVHGFYIQLIYGLMITTAVTIYPVVMKQR